MSYFGLCFIWKRPLLFVFLAMTQQQQPSLYYNFWNNLLFLLWSCVSLLFGRIDFSTVRAWRRENSRSSQIKVGNIDCSRNRIIYPLYLPHRWYNNNNSRWSERWVPPDTRVSVPPLCLSLTVVWCLSSVTVPSSRAEVWDDKGKIWLIVVFLLFFL